MQTCRKGCQPLKSYFLFNEQVLQGWQPYNSLCKICQILIRNIQSIFVHQKKEIKKLWQQ